MQQNSILPTLTVIETCDSILKVSYECVKCSSQLSLHAYFVLFRIVFFFIVFVLFMSSNRVYLSYTKWCDFSTHVEYKKPVRI